VKNSYVFLFWVKFIKGKQLPLEFETIKPEELLIQAINEKPGIDTKEGYSWHIGNTSSLDNRYGSFAIGRKTLTALPHYDIEKKDFVESMSETSPYTMIYFDSVIGLLGIKRNYHLAPRESSIAKKIEQLLASTAIIRRSMTYVEVDAIKDPMSFINKLRNAYSIKKFTVTFGGPNPFDADEIFHKPMSIYLQEAEGKEGKTIIDGENLNAETLVQMTRSVAATGNNAVARFRNSANEKIISASLRDNPAKIVISQEMIDEEKINQKLIAEYTKVRNQ
jgi:hypothetical protein